MTFEIRETTSEDDQFSLTSYKGIIPQICVPLGVGSRTCRRTFNVNKWPLSSSLFRPSDLGVGEDPQYDHVKLWGENVELDYELNAKVSTIDTISKQLQLPLPNFLSIDAQGAELEILNGAQGAFATSIVGAMTEVEWSEIYQSQCLFHEQMSFYVDKGFRYVGCTPPQKWHPGPRMPGLAFDTVAEALFIKYIRNFDNKSIIPVGQCITLSDCSDITLVRTIALSKLLGLLSYAMVLLEYVHSSRTCVLPILHSTSFLQGCLQMYEYYRSCKHLADNDPYYHFKNYDKIPHFTSSLSPALHGYTNDGLISSYLPWPPFQA